MEGMLNLKLKMVSNPPEDFLMSIAKLQQKNGKFRQSSTYQIKLKNYSLYFCNINDLKNKRYLLQPISLYLYLDQFYSKIR